MEDKLAIAEAQVKELNELVTALGQDYKLKEMHYWFAVRMIASFFKLPDSSIDRIITEEVGSVLRDLQSE